MVAKDAEWRMAAWLIEPPSHAPSPCWLPRCHAATLPRRAPHQTSPNAGMGCGGCPLHMPNMPRAKTSGQDSGTKMMAIVFAMTETACRAVSPVVGFVASLLIPLVPTPYLT